MRTKIISIKKPKTRVLCCDNRSQLLDLLGVKNIYNEQNDLLKIITRNDLFKQIEASAYAYFIRQKDGTTIYKRNQQIAKVVTYLMYHTDVSKEDLTILASASLLYGVKHDEINHIIKHTPNARSISSILQNIYNAKIIMVDSIKYFKELRETNLQTKDNQQSGKSSLKTLDDPFELDASTAKNKFLANNLSLPMAFFLIAESVSTLTHSFELLGNEQKQATIKQSLVLGDIALELGFENIKTEIHSILLQKSQNNFLVQYLLKEIKKIYKTDYSDLQNILNKKLEIIENILKDNHIQAQVQGRIKGLYSLRKKLKERYKTKGIQNVNDIIAIRIVARNEEDIERIKTLITLLDRITRKTDYIKNPKEYGYQSIHFSLLDKEERTYEIQLRTVTQHIHAETLYSHINYKHDKKDKFFREPLFIPKDKNDEKKLKLRLNQRYREMSEQAIKALKNSQQEEVWLIERIIEPKE